MALTYGFFNSKDGDRKYNAEQFGSIFDGVIEDGVYMQIGNRLMVKASGSGFQVNIQTGRAWFNHTWTLNDSIYAITLPQPEVLLDKYVAVCLEVNATNNVRKNSFVTVAGTPASNPQYPTLTNTNLVHQIPLAFCRVRAGATAITQADITNTIGTSRCPFVTGAVQNMKIDDLIAQWESQYRQWYNANNTEFTTFMTNSRNTFNTFMTNSGNTFNTFMTQSGTTFDDFMASSGTTFDNFMTESHTTFDTFMQESRNEESDFMYASNAAFNAFMTRIDTAWEDFLNNGQSQIDTMLANLGDDFDSFWDDFKARMNSYLTQTQTDFTTWFNHIKGQLDTDAAANLQNQIDSIKYIYVNQNRVVLPNTAASVSGSRLILSTP